MPPLKLLILFLLLTTLQTAVISLPFLYWRFQPHLSPTKKLLFGLSLLSIAFIIHPLIITTLITFTIAPTLLSLRHNMIKRTGALYAYALGSVPTPTMAFDKGLPRGNKEWAMALLGGYAGWKVLGTLPSLLLVGLYAKRRFVDGLKVVTKGLQKRSGRTDLQVVQ